MGEERPSAVPPSDQETDESVRAAIRPPGGSLSVAVAGPAGLRSSVWRIWGTKNSDDVYLAPRSAARHFKISLHQSGQWQESITSENAMRYVETNQARHLGQWMRPEPIDSAITDAYFILVPRTELRAYDESLEGVVMAPDAGPNGWVYIEIFLVEPGTNVQLESEHGLEELGRIALPGGGMVWVVATPTLPVKDFAVGMRERRDGIVQAIVAGDDYVSQIVPNDGSPLTTTAIECIRSDGTHGQIEMAFSDPPPEVRRICTGAFAEVGRIGRPGFLRDSFTGWS
jgi:hypothetical protein